MKRKDYTIMRNSNDKLWWVHEIVPSMSSDPIGNSTSMFHNKKYIPVGQGYWNKAFAITAMKRLQKVN